MPHFLAKNISLPPLPFCEGGYEFLFEVFGVKNPNESLICVRFQNEKFFVRKITYKNGDVILKADKITKPNPVGILKGALRVLKNHSTSITHNLNNDSMRQKTQSPFLLKPFEVKDFRDFYIEIGFGSGRHLLEMAKENPHSTYIGIEIHTPSIEQVLRQIELLGLKNLFILCADARVLLEVLRSNQCNGIYVHFPIPWNKKPHRRVLNEKFLSEALRVLKKDCALELRSDDEIYFKDSLELALSAKNARLEIAKNHSSKIVSKYEARWQKQNKNIYDLRIFADFESEDKKLEYDFIFSSLELRDLELLYKKSKIVRDDYFLHIFDSFCSREMVILGVSFGDFNQPVNQWVIFTPKEAYYFGGNPLGTQATFKAHQELLKLLAEDK